MTNLRDVQSDIDIEQELADILDQEIRREFFAMLNSTSVEELERMKEAKEQSKMLELYIQAFYS